VIEGFEDITYDLTDFEKSLVPGFVASLVKRVGKDKAITSKEIIAAYATKGVVINDARIRKIINHIRTGYLVKGLMATSKGYYVSVDRQEIAEYCASLGHREAAIGSVRKVMEEYLKDISSPDHS